MEDKKMKTKGETNASRRKSKENIRSAIKSIFGRRRCVTLVTPFD